MTEQPQDDQDGQDTGDQEAVALLYQMMGYPPEYSARLASGSQRPAPGKGNDDLFRGMLGR